MTPHDPITRRIVPRTKQLGPLAIRRLLPQRETPMVGPFIYFDHIGPVTFAPGEGLDVPTHPHIGLCTVTYPLEGAILHRDSLGCVQRIRPGELNLMVAGRGVVHSERTPPDLRAEGHTLHAIQLWFALPDAYEETAPTFDHYDADALPHAESGGVSLRLLIGDYFGMTSPAHTFSDTFFADVHMQSDSRLSLPESNELALYLLEGRLESQGQTLHPLELTLLDTRSPITIQAAKSSRFLLLGGAPVGQKEIVWNFVSGSKERIETAVRQWEENAFDPVPGDLERIATPKGAATR